MKINMFDYIYHEHFSYFTADVLNKIFQSCRLGLIHTKKTKPKGGSLRVVAQLEQGTRMKDTSVDNILEEESQNRIEQAQTYINFAEQINIIKDSVLKELQELKNKGKRIVGLGASHSTTTLIYHFELAAFIDYLVDDNELKYGSYSPGHHLPVYPSDKLYKDKPDYVILLAWQHTDSILSKHKTIFNLGMKFIAPLPELKIIDSLE